MMMNKYKVNATIRGAIHRPYYEGYIDVWADNDNDAVFRAKRNLVKQWGDINLSDIKVTSVERTWA
ncbi:MAG: hypothetical protein ACYSW6_10255 [Planctomycetota bacterium]